MRRGQTTLICLLGGSLLVPTARGAADSNGNAYQTIAASNPFRLKPIPPPPSTEPEKLPPSNITLTGITTIFNDKLALMEVQQPSGKPKLFLTLSEGQRDGDVEVVSIDEKNGVVRVSNQGVPQTLDLKDANKRVASAIPAANPGPANPMAIPNAPAVPAPAAANNSVVNVGARKIPRIPRGPTADNVMVAGGGTTTGGTTTGGTMTGGTMTRDAQSGQQMSPVDQAVLMEVNRELTKDKVARGEMPPLPPTTPPPGPQ